MSTTILTETMAELTLSPPNTRLVTPSIDRELDSGVEGLFLLSPADYQRYQYLSSLSVVVCFSVVSPLSLFSSTCRPAVSNLLAAQEGG